MQAPLRQTGGGALSIGPRAQRAGTTVSKLSRMSQDPFSPRWRSHFYSSCLTAREPIGLASSNQTAQGRARHGSDGRVTSNGCGGIRTDPCAFEDAARHRPLTSRKRGILLVPCPRPTSALSRMRGACHCVLRFVSAMLSICRSVQPAPALKKSSTRETFRHVPQSWFFERV